MSNRPPPQTKVAVSDGVFMGTEPKRPTFWILSGGAGGAAPRRAFGGAAEPHEPRSLRGGQPGVRRKLARRAGAVAAAAGGGRRHFANAENAETKDFQSQVQEASQDPEARSIIPRR